jgi:DnaJ-class molecular chaperone
MLCVVSTRIFSVSEKIRVETFKLIRQVYQILFDLEKRKIYNANLSSGFKHESWIMNSLFPDFKFSNPHDVFKQAF